MFLLFTRASNKHPMLHDVLHLCLTDLLHKLTQAQVTRIHLPIYDPERSINILSAWYSMLRDHFIDSNVNIVLHDRVYVSIASVKIHPTSKAQVETLSKAQARLSLRSTKQ